MRSRFLAISGTIVGLALPTPAVAAPAWLAAVDLASPSTGAVAPAMSVDAEGNATAAWARTGGAGWQVQTTTRRVGASTWARTTTLDTSAGIGAMPVVASSSTGGSLALWEHRDGTHVRIRASWRSSTSAPWSVGIDLSPASQDAQTPQVSFDGAGNATAVWASGGTEQRILTASRPAATGIWSAPVVLDDGAYPARRSPRLSVSPDGRAIAAWAVTTASAEGIATGSGVQVATRSTATGSWGTPSTVSATDTVILNPETVIDRAGNATVTWARRYAGGTRIEAVSKAAGAAGWTAPTSISGDGQAMNPKIGADDAGGMTVTWRQIDGTSARIRSAARSATTGLWSAPSWASSTGEQANGFAQAISGDGRATVVWESSASGLGSRLLTAVRQTPTGVWTPPARIATASFDAQPTLATDPDGNAAAAWVLRSSGTTRVQAAGYDGAGPLLSGPASVSVPGVGHVGRPVAMSAAPIDAWSAVADTTWSFGDGTKASGTAVSHSYSAPGSYRVTVRSTDTLGLVRSTTRLIKIT